MTDAQDALGKCEVCGNTGTVHVTVVDETGQSTSCCLCLMHAQEGGYLVSSPSEGIVNQLQKLIDFMKANQRMPSSDELQQFGSGGDLSSTQPGSPEFYRQLAYLESVVEFVKTQRRFPTQEELPDPF